jgi:protein-S-isoprenylcysteine O-methyltransferase Ste14
LGTLWFYVGLPITLIGLVALIQALVDWARTPPDELVSRGLYRYSRHPLYVTTSLYLIGVSIASASWIFLLFPIIMTVGAVVFINFEEEECLKQYGDTYRKYMKRTPRWLGLPKSSEVD